MKGWVSIVFLLLAATCFSLSIITTDKITGDMRTRLWITAWGAMIMGNMLRIEDRLTRGR